MSLRRVVFLDPDGTAPPWMHVVVEASTGVVYEQQYGGTAILFGRVEGYLVPVHHAQALAELRAVFERTLSGAGTSQVPLPGMHLDRVRRAVAQIRLWRRGDDGQDHPIHLSVDERRLAELDEAWVPVATPDGPGYLLWKNSD